MARTCKYVKYFHITELFSILQCAFHKELIICYDLLKLFIATEEHLSTYTLLQSMYQVHICINETPLVQKKSKNLNYFSNARHQNYV